jgi:hypothetical protein
LALEVKEMSDPQAPMARNDAQCVIAGWQTITEFAHDVNRTERTVARWIGRGMPVIRVGATRFIDPTKARKWFLDGMPSPTSSPRLRRRA